MDLSFTQNVDTHTVTILEPTDDYKPTDVKITVLSANSKEYRKIKAKCSISDDDERAIHLLAMATQSWENLEFDGELKCNYKNAKMLYENSSSVMYQVLKVYLDDANFMKGKG